MEPTDVSCFLTGYFADAKVSEFKRSKVHIVNSDKTPICGTKVSGDFQFCANGIQWDYVECEKCVSGVEKELSCVGSRKNKMDQNNKNNTPQQCPFCTSTKTQTMKHLTYGPDSHFEYSVYCANCGARGPSELSKDSAKKSWNMRRMVFTGKE